MTDPIFEIFQEETRDHLQALEGGFLDLEVASHLQRRRSIVDAMFRHAHSIKGDARALGIAELQTTAHDLESLLDQLRQRPETSSQKHLVDQGLKNLDQLKNEYETWQARFTGQAISTDSALPASPDETSASVSAASTGDETFVVRIPSERLDRMLNQTATVRIALRAGSLLTTQLSEVREQLDQLARTKKSDARSAIESAADAVRRIEVTIRQQQSREQLLLESLETDIRQSRLLQLSLLLDSFRRPIRDLAQSLGKSIQYEFNTGDILLDKAVIEALRTPLLHLIRNAADHGIEAPAARRERNKPAHGTIRVEAQQQGTFVQITVSDDGAGIHLDRVRQRLQQVDGLTSEEVHELSDQELAGQLFRPGFTTSQVGNISGWGVGLDLVKERLNALHGRVEVQQSRDSGTTFKLTVPVSIATIRILTVWNANHSYAIPSDRILHTGRIRPVDLKEVEGTTVIFVNGEPVRWVMISDLLGTDSGRKLIPEDFCPYLMIFHKDQRLAIGVDELDEEREVLLKPLGFPLAGMPGVMGGAIRPDGSVKLVIDVTNPVFHRSSAPLAGPAIVERPARIMIVDDSPTTRAILRNLFSAAGYIVVTATDGIDALEKLRSQSVDLVISDFEMPRLNGVDLTRQIKSRHEIPVILVTGRETEQHRREGLEAGADAYVVKSTFQGESLLDVVKQFV